MGNDNAAYRLLQLLLKARQIENKTTSVRAWESVLQTKNNPGLFLARLGKMIGLPHEISELLTNVAGANPEVIRHISHQIYAAFVSHKFDQPWQEFVGRIDTHVINYLELASTLLENRQTTKELSEEQLKDLRDKFNAVLDQVRASDIAPRLKAYIVLQLHELLAAIDDYFITGAQPILQRVEAAIGHAYVDSEYKTFLRDSEIGKSLLDSLGAAANLVTVAIGIPQLAQVVQLIQGG